MLGFQCVEGVVQSGSAKVIVLTEIRVHRQEAISRTEIEFFVRIVEVVCVKVAGGTEVVTERIGNLATVAKLEIYFGTLVDVCGPRTGVKAFICRAPLESSYLTG